MVLITTLISGSTPPQEGQKNGIEIIPCFCTSTDDFFFFWIFCWLLEGGRRVGAKSLVYVLGPFYFHLHALYRQKKERRGLVDGTACHSPSKIQGFPATDKVVCRSQRRATLYDHRATLTSIMTIWILISCQLPVLSKYPCSRKFPWNVARW